MNCEAFCDVYSDPATKEAVIQLRCTAHGVLHRVRHIYPEQRSTTKRMFANLWEKHLAEIASAREETLPTHLL